MSEAVISTLMGYMLGGLSPAAVLAAVKKIDLQKHGTKNLGATNVALIFGKWYGIVVMLLDVGKAFVAVKLAKRLFPGLLLSGLFAGCAAVVGHIYPVYLKFRGGKGLAAFGGMILALDPVMFLILLVIGIAVMLITNYAIAVPFSAASLAPFLAGFRFDSITAFFIVSLSSSLILMKHMENIGRIKSGEEIGLREFIKTRMHN